ncbi:GNAT family N-acetyltransferase [Ferrimonas pelagia]|uniref:N-acetyltransferase domain-containing protein n=1 Tax=Ferrimonas pelagia TaxID=1177826 RepID=A0ABP9EKK7_9GAMM
MNELIVYFSSPRLTLRSCALEDVGWLLELLADADVAPAFHRLGLSTDAHDLGLTRLIESAQSGRYLLAGFDALGEAVGVLALWPDSDGRPWVMLAVCPSYRRQGYGNEMLRAWSHYFQQHSDSTDPVCFFSESVIGRHMATRAGFQPAVVGENTAEGYRLPT